MAQLQRRLRPSHSKMGRTQTLNLFSKCSKETGSIFLHQIIDGICDRGSAQYPKFSETWTMEEWWDVVEAYTTLYREAVRTNWNKDNLCEAVSGLDGPHQQVVLDSYVSRRDELKKHLTKVACNISNCCLKDFDWQLKLVMSSDKLSSIQEPLVNLDLGLGAGNDSQNVSLELNKDDLKKLITSLELANKDVSRIFLGKLGED